MTSAPLGEPFDLPEGDPDAPLLRRLLGPNRRRLIVVNDRSARDRACATDLIVAGWSEYDGPGTAQLGWYQGDDPKIGPAPGPLMRSRRAQG